MSNSNKEGQNIDEPQFDWITLHREIHENVSSETTQDKFIRKFKENPFVPLGKFVVLT